MPPTRGRLSWWRGNTVKCEGCKLTFPMLDDVFQVVCVQGDPCAWHREFLEPLPVVDREAARHG